MTYTSPKDTYKLISCKRGVMLANTTVYKDQRGVCVAGYSKSIPTDSFIIGIENVLMNQLSRKYCPETIQDNPQKSLLHLLVPMLGDIWIGETEASWQQKVNAAQASNPRITRTYEFLVGTDIPAGLTLSSPLIKNVQVQVIVIDGVPSILQDIPYTAVDPGNSNNGLLDFTSVGGLSGGSKLSITVTPL